MPKKVLKICKSFAFGKISKAYARRVWGRSSDTGGPLTDLPSLDKQDVLMAEEEEVFAPESAVVEVPAVDVDALLTVDVDDDRELNGAFDLGEAKNVGVKRNLRELQERRRAKRQKVPRSAAEAFTKAK